MLERMRGTILGLVALACLLAVGVLAGCAGDEMDKEGIVETAPVPASVVMQVGAYEVPFLSFMDRAAAGETHNQFAFAVVPSFQEVVTTMEEGNADMAVLAPSAASILYNNNEHSVSVVAISTLASYTLVSQNGAVKEPADLAGKTLYMNRSSALAIVAMDALIDQAGVRDQVEIIPDGSPARQTARVLADENAVAMLEQPYAAAAAAMDVAAENGKKVSEPAVEEEAGGDEAVEDEAGEEKADDKEQPQAQAAHIHEVMSLADAWDATIDSPARLVGGVVIVRNEFLRAHPKAVEEFLVELAASAEMVANDPTSMEESAVAHRAVTDASQVPQALYGSHPVCITGETMREVLSAYFAIFDQYYPGTLGTMGPPDDAFYYLGPDAATTPDAGATDATAAGKATGESAQDAEAAAPAEAEVTAADEAVQPAEG